LKLEFVNAAKLVKGLIKLISNIHVVLLLALNIFIFLLI